MTFLSDLCLWSADNSKMRKSDPNDGTHFRSADRVFCMNGSWFFQTREADHGPFSSEDSARAELQRYVDEMHYFDSIGPEEAKLTPKTATNDYANFSLVDKDSPA